MGIRREPWSYGLRMYVAKYSVTIDGEAVSAEDLDMEGQDEYEIIAKRRGQAEFRAKKYRQTLSGLLRTLDDNIKVKLISLKRVHN